MVGGTTMLRVPALMVAVAVVEAEATDESNGRASHVCACCQSHDRRQATESDVE